MTDISTLIIHLFFFIGMISYVFILIDISKIKDDLDYLTTLIEALLDKEGEEDDKGRSY